MIYLNESTVAAQITNAKSAAVAGDKDSAFDFLSAALDCSTRSAAELAEIDTIYAEIKAA